MMLWKEWLKFAEDDLRAAEHMFSTMYPKPLEIICYHCQQAVEKILKAILISNDLNVVKTHDLSFLLGRCVNFVRVEERQIDICGFLTPFGVIVRYPNELPVDEKMAEKALEYAGEFMDWGKQLLRNK